VTDSLKARHGVEMGVFIKYLKSPGPNRSYPNAKKHGFFDNLKDCLKYLQERQIMYQAEYKRDQLAAHTPQFRLDGRWNNSDAEIISYRVESVTGNLELVWSESHNGRFRFSGKVDGLESKGTIEKWKDSFDGISLIFGDKAGDRYESHGAGCILLTKNFRTLTIKVMESAAKNQRSMTFHRGGE
jgi:hypothetical protein